MTNPSPLAGEGGPRAHLRVGGRGVAIEPLSALSLVGDGDEMDAVKLLEKRLNISFDSTVGSKWVTVGDVYRDALKLAPEPQTHRRTWVTLCAAFCFYQVDDPRRVRPETVLIGSGIPVWTYLRQSFERARTKWL